MSIIFDITGVDAMSFQQKSAWIMSFALVVGGLYYFGAVSNMSQAIGHLAPPNMPAVVTYTVLLVVIAVVGHIVIAAASPKEADAPLDERERKIFHWAGNVSSYVLGIGVIWSLGFYLFRHDGDVLFYSVFASLMLCQLAEYLIQIALYRIDF
jgi:uncharacterized membrane protein (DUF485 family)